MCASRHHSTGLQKQGFEEPLLVASPAPSGHGENPCGTATPSFPFRAGICLGLLAQTRPSDFHWLPSCELRVKSRHLHEETQIQILKADLDPVRRIKQAEIIIHEVIRGLVQTPGFPTRSEETSAAIHIKCNGIAPPSMLQLNLSPVVMSTGCLAVRHPPASVTQSHC